MRLYEKGVPDSNFWLPSNAAGSLAVSSRLGGKAIFDRLMLLQSMLEDATNEEDSKAILRAMNTPESMSAEAFMEAASAAVRRIEDLRYRESQGREERVALLKVLQPTREGQKVRPIELEEEDGRLQGGRIARRAKARTYPELTGAGRARLVVLGIETGGRWSEEAVTFIRLLANHKASSTPPSLRRSAALAWTSRWTALLATAAMRSAAAAASYVCWFRNPMNTIVIYVTWSPVVARCEFCAQIVARWPFWIVMWSPVVAWCEFCAESGLPLWRCGHFGSLRGPSLRRSPRKLPTTRA